MLIERREREGRRERKKEKTDRSGGRLCLHCGHNSASVFCRFGNAKTCVYILLYSYIKYILSLSSM